jgi:hypothetical protein
MSGNGRDEANGRFATGNPGGPGGSHTSSATAEEDEELALKTLRRVQRSRKATSAAQVAAAKELLNRRKGLPIASDAMRRIEELERMFSQAPTKEPGNGVTRQAN